MAADLRQALELPAQVISLRRSQERRAAFAQRNGETGRDFQKPAGAQGSAERLEQGCDRFWLEPLPDVAARSRPQPADLCAGRRRLGGIGLAEVLF